MTLATKHYFMPVFIALSLIGLLLSIQTDSQTTYTYNSAFSGGNNFPYINPTPGEIPIIASSPWVANRMSSLSELKDIKSCGFNTVLSLTSLSHFNRVEPMLNEAGLKAIIGLPQFSSVEGLEIIKTLKQSPVIGGWRLSDEPKTVDFGTLRKLYDEAWRMDSTHMPYINLVGSGGGKSYFGEGGTYDTYLKQFQKDFRPGVWSYDLYPISIKDKKIKVNYSSFYNDLETYSQLSKTTKRPFWAYCQSMAYSSPHHERPAATVSTLSFEAFSALGYGAKGLVYWTYCLRKSNERETFKSALVDMNCKKTKAWYAAQQVNGEIRALNEVFMTTHCIDTWHTGGNISPKCKRFAGNVGCIKTMEGEATGFQISLLASADTSYVIIVNKDVEQSQSISLTLAEGYKVSKLSPVKASGTYKIKEEVLSKSYKTKVPSGRYLILQYNKTN